MRIRPLTVHIPLMLQQVIMPYKTVSAFAFTILEVTWEELFLGRRKVCFQMAFQVCFAREWLLIFAGVHNAEVLCWSVD
jgi:hypothetical protein